MAKKVFIMDSVKTIIGTLLIALGLQFLAYPIINQRVGNEAFGSIFNDLYNNNNHECCIRQYA